MGNSLLSIINGKPLSMTGNWNWQKDNILQYYDEFAPINAHMCRYLAFVSIHVVDSLKVLLAEHGSVDHKHIITNPGDVVSTRTNLTAHNLVHRFRVSGSRRATFARLYK